MMPSALTVRRASSSNRHGSKWRPLVRLHNPFVLLLLLLVPLLMRWLRNPNRATLRYPLVASLRSVGNGRRYHYQWVRPALWIVSISLLVVALARPQMGKASTKITTEGIDI